MPSYMNFDKLIKKFSIKPTLPDLDLGMKIVQLSLSDSKISNDYSFTVNVRNFPPFFEQPLKDLKLPLNTEYTYKLPFIIKKEKLPYKMIV